MVKFKNQFCNKDFDDFTEYRYDVTNYMRDLMGDFVAIITSFCSHLYSAN